MSENGKTDFLLKKSYEISYALWRVAANIPENSYGSSYAVSLSRKAIEIMDWATGNYYSGLAARISDLEIFIRFGMDVGCISVSNGEILISEIGNFKSAIAEKDIAIDKSEELDISNIFSGAERSANGEQEEVYPEETKIEIDDPEIAAGNEIGNKSEIRQSAILERIRQIGNCRLGDIQEVLPNVSDRTIRYDLESMVQRNLIERIGTGGRSVYYRVAGEQPIGG